MNKYWNYLWMILLLLQVITFWLSQRWARTNAPAPYGINSELMDLARLTNQQWLRMGLLEETTGELSGDGSNDADLLERESLILQLKEAEDSLSLKGSQIELVDDLKKWGAAKDLRVGRSQIGEYLINLLKWVSPFLEDSPPCILQRLVLYPDTRSQSPSLAFELAGEPSSMGRSLLSFERNIPVWQLNELDIFRPGENENWWMRGSLSFLKKSVH